MDFTISRRLSSGHLYAYYKKRFWFWDDTRNIWTESHLMSQKYEREHSARAALTPEDFMSDLTRFSPLDEYELDSVMVDALKNAIPCKTVPIEPVKEESECPQSSESAPSEASANVSSVLTSAPPMNCTPDVSIGTPSGMNPPDKPLTFIPENKTPEFDYSGLDKQTVEDLHFAEDEYRHGKKLAERGLVHMGNAIAAAHDALCGVVQQLDNSKHGNRGDDSFRAWCCSIGITKSSAYNLLQVSALMEGSSPRQKAVLESLPPTLLYAVAKPSAPEELVEKVKNGEVSSNKEYQEALKQLKEKDAQLKLSNKRIDELQAHSAKLTCDYNDEFVKRRQAESKLDETRTRLKSACIQEQKSREAMQAAENARDAALADMQGLSEQNNKLKEENAALKKQPITAVVDEEEVDKRAHQQAYAIAADMTSELREQLEAAQAAPPVDPQEDIETATSCIVNITGIWSMATPTFTRLVGIGEEFDQLADALLQTCDRIKKEVIAMIAENDGGLKDE